MHARARRRAGAAIGVVAFAVVCAVACTSTTLQGSLAIVTGPDNGFLEKPVPTLLDVQFVSNVGGNVTVTPGATTRLPSDGALNLPSQPGANVDTIQITGYADGGDAVVSGTTVPVALDQLSGITLNIFVQRTGQFSRLPAANGDAAAVLGAPSNTPLLTTLYSRYLLVADNRGQSTATQLYDNLTWQPEPEAGPCLSLPSLSLAFVPTWTGGDSGTDGGSTIGALLQLGRNGTANWLDITDSTGCGPDAQVASDAMTPPGGSFAAAAGGQTILGLTNSFVVGATRTNDGGATTGVLRISPSGVLSWTNLQVPRLGAAAVYSSGGTSTGVYIFGGNLEGDGGADASGGTLGVEFVSDNGGEGTASTPFPLPTDTTRGAGAVVLNASTTPFVVLAGGVKPDGKPAPVRIYSVANGTTDAAPGVLDGGAWPPLPVTFVSTQLYALSDTTSPHGAAVIVIGTEKSGVTSAYIIGQKLSAAVRVPFRVGRTNAQSILLPNGSLAVVGGDSGTIESFIP